MLQAASIYTQGHGNKWKEDETIKIMVEIAETSLKILSKDLFNQLAS